jgi:hypothetical protein
MEAAKVSSNAKTKVTIAGAEYTVADAIKRKEDIEYDKSLLREFEAQRRLVIAQTDSANLEAERQADKHIEALFNGQSSKTEQVNPREVEKQRESFMRNHRWEVIDPNGADKCINALRAEIESFEAEVDAVLSESNAITMVTVELED